MATVAPTTTTTPTPPSPVTTSTAVTEQQDSANASAQVAGNFSEFLTLLTTQLQNQDPMSPMDTNQFTQELVEFSGVEQQINTNQKLDSLVSLGVSNGLNSALGYVGMDINYASTELNFDGSTPVQVNYALNSAAASNTINVVDETSGDIVYTTAGATTTGQNSFTWDGSETNGGKAPAGTYALQVNAFDANGSQIASTSVVSGHVNGVESQDGVINLLVGQGASARAVPLANVLNAIQPPPVAAAAATGGTG